MRRALRSKSRLTRISGTSKDGFAVREQAMTHVPHVFPR